MSAPSGKATPGRVCNASFIEKGENGWVDASTSELTLKYQRKGSERSVPGEKIEHLRPVPRGTPNVVHFLRQDQQPIVELLPVIVVVECQYICGIRDGTAHQERHGRSYTKLTLVNWMSQERERLLTDHCLTS